jgi:hypothetical protein
VQSQHRVGDVDVGRIEFELFDEQLEELRDMPLWISTRRLHRSAATQFDFEGDQQVVGLVLFEVRSALRVTRKRSAAKMVMPGNSCPRLAMMRSSKQHH